MMRANRYTLAKLCLLAALAVPAQRAASATVSQGTQQASALQLIAQGDTDSQFTLPASLEDASSLLVDGSSSMRNMTTALTAQFQEQYENAEVEFEASGSDVAIERLLNEEIDLAAIGRPLTQAEKDAGLSEVAIAREKIAIIVGPDNPFEGDITFEQLAKILEAKLQTGLKWAASQVRSDLSIGQNSAILVRHFVPILSFRKLNLSQALLQILSVKMRPMLWLML